MDQKILQIVLKGKDELSNVIKGAANDGAKAAENVESGFKKWGAAAVATGAAMTGAGIVLQKISNDSVSATTQWAGSVSRLARETGSSTEAMSKLLYAGQRYGIETDGMSKSLGLFAKQVVAANSGQQTAIDNFNHIGVSVKNANGEMKPFDQLFGEVADKFKAAPAGMDKTAEAMKLFGKSGKDMLPLLNQGSAGMKELGDQAEKFGLVLTQKNIAAFKDYRKASFEGEQATKGLQIQMGLISLGPATKMKEAFASIAEKLNQMPSGIKTVIGNIIAFGGPVLSAAGSVVTLGGSLAMMASNATIAGIATGALEAILSPITLVVLAVGAGVLLLVKHFGGWHQTLEKLKPVQEAITNAWKNDILPALKKVGEIILSILKPAWDALVQTFKKDVMPVLQKIGEYIAEHKKVFAEIGKVVAVVFAGSIVVAIGIVVGAIWLLLNVARLLIGWAKDMAHWGKLAFEGFMDGVHAVGAAFTWVYNNIIDPIWHGIMDGVHAVAAVIDYIWKWIVAITMAEWRIIWEVAINPIWQLIKAVAQVVGGAIIAVWNWIKDVASSVWNAISGVITGVWNWVKGVWNGAVDWFSGIWRGIADAASGIVNGIKNTFGGIWDSIKGGAKSAANWVIDHINDMIDKVNSIASKVPGAPKLGHIGRLYGGTPSWEGGLVEVGDVVGGSGELINLPRGAKVYSNRESREQMGKMGGGVNVVVNNQVNNQVDLGVMMRDIGYILKRNT